MLKELKFVKGSVAKKDLLPSLSHFRIENGRVFGYNGRIALSAPIDVTINCIPKAEPLVRAIDRCTEAVQLGLTPSGKLSVKSGKFRAYIECVEGKTPHVKPEGQYVDVNGDVLLKALKTLEPLIGDDASKQWTNGILFDGPSAFATNNVILAEYWLGAAFPIRINIPREAVKEILRIKSKPTQFQVTDSSFTVHYEDGCWLRSNLINSEWPNVVTLLNDNLPTNAVLIPETFFEDIEQIKSFTDNNNRVIFDPGIIRTHMVGSEEGAIIESTFINSQGSYVDSMLLKLKGLATKIDFTPYPDKPSPWVGESLRGVIIGLRWLDE